MNTPMANTHPKRGLGAAFLLLIATGVVEAAGLPPIDPVGTYVLRSAEEKVTLQHTGRSPESKRVPIGFSGVIKVVRIDGDHVLVDLDGNKGFPSFNQGGFTATLRYRHDTAVYTPSAYDDSCVVTLTWSRAGVLVSQVSNDANTACGFGHAVAVDGFYRRISSRHQRIRKPN